jgi:hypothetical protein
MWPRPVAERTSLSRPLRVAVDAALRDYCLGRPHGCLLVSTCRLRMRGPWQSQHLMAHFSAGSVILERHISGSQAKSQSSARDSWCGKEQQAWSGLHSGTPAFAGASFHAQARGRDCAEKPAPETAAREAFAALLHDSQKYLLYELSSLSRPYSRIRVARCRPATTWQSGYADANSRGLRAPLAKR